MSDRDAPAGLPRPVPRAPARVLPRARGALLGLRVPGPALGRPRGGLPGPAAGALPGGGAARAGGERLLPALRAAPLVVVEEAEAEEAARALRMGRADVVVSAPADPGAPVEYRLDPSRPEAGIARSRVDDALQRAAGRADLVPFREVAFERARRPLRGLPRARAHRHEPDERGDVGRRLRPRGHADQEAAEAAAGDADAGRRLHGGPDGDARRCPRSSRSARSSASPRSRWVCPSAARSRR